MAKEKGQSIFPKLFDRCPGCGCRETTTQMAWREQVDAGRISQESADLPVACKQEPIPLVDPKRGPGIAVPVLIHYYDVCVKCGKQYCVRADIITAPVSMMQAGQKGQGLPPFGHNFPGMNNPKRS